MYVPLICKIKLKLNLLKCFMKSRFSCCYVEVSNFKDAILYSGGGVGTGNANVDPARVKPQNKNNENLESREIHVVIFCLIVLHRFLILVSAVISNFILHVEHLLCYLQRFPRHSTLATALELVSDVMIVYYLYFNMFNEKC